MLRKLSVRALWLCATHVLSANAGIDSNGQGPTKDGAFVALALRAVRGPIHFDFPRQGIATTPRSEADALK
jgi:hypothetical protein